MLDIWDRLRPAVEREARRRRTAPSRPAARPRLAPTAPAADPVARAARQVGTTAKRAGSASNRGVGEAVARTPSIRSVRRVRRDPLLDSNRESARPQRVDPEWAAIRREVEEYERRTSTEAGRAAFERQFIRTRPSVVQQRIARLRERIEASDAQSSRGGITPQQAAIFRARGLGDGGGRSLGGFLQNLGRGAVDAVVNLPAGAQLAGEAALYPVAAGYNTLTGNRRGGHAGDRVARGLERQTRSDLQAAGRGIAADYQHRYGPLVEGDLATFGARFYDDPLPTLLDAGAAYSAVGRAPGVAARAGSRITTGRTSERLAQAGSRSITAPGEIDPSTGKPRTAPGKLYRPPRRVTGTTAYEGASGRVTTGTRTIEVPRRPYSPNVITRAGQRGADRLRERVTPRIEAAAARRQVAPGSPQTTSDALGAALARPFTEQGRFDRAIRRQTRDLIDVRTQRAAGLANRDTLAFSRAVRALRPDKNPGGVERKGLGVEAVALRLHLEDVLSPRGGLTPRQLRDRVVERMEQGLAKAERKGERTANARRNLELIRAIPDELLDLNDSKNPAVARVRTALEEGRKLDAVAQARQVRAGVVSAETARAARSRTSALLLGGSEWAPAVLKELKRAGASKAERAAVRASAIAETPRLRELRARADAAERQLAEVEGRAPGQRELRRVYRAGQRSGMAGVRLSTAPRLRPGQHRQPVMPRPGETPAAAERAATVTPTQVPGMPLRGRSGEARPTGISAGQGAQYAAKLAGEARAYTARTAAKGGTPAKVKAATRKRDKYLKAVRREEDRSLGFTPPTRPDLVGDKGVYIPKRPIDPMGAASGRGPGRGMSGPAKTKRSTGYLIQKGGFDLNPALLAHQARRATSNEVGPMSNAALEEFVGLAAYRDPKGKFLTGRRAAQLARTDPDRVVLVNVGRLREVMRKLDELEEGRFLEPGEVRMFHGEGREPWLEAIPEGALSSDYVAISKAAADVWREAPTTNPVLRAHDTLMSYWKGALLAISPRWLVNNVVGVGSQYGLLTGMDIRSIQRANRLGPIREAIPDTVALNTLAEDVGFKGKIDANRIERILTAGFRVNNRMESAWRRAAFLNRSMAYLRREGARTRRLTDAEVARAIDSMPESVARQIIRDVDLYLGDFRRFTRFEREVVKRGLPFWSWLRTISRLTFSLPFRSPVRAEALAVLGRAGQYGINPEDYQRPLYERGGIRFGDYRVPTMGLNPFATLAEPVSAATKIARDPGSGLGTSIEAGLAWGNPLLQLGASQAFGTTAFGQPVIAPTGYGSTAAGWRGSQTIDPVTGLPEDARARIPWHEALLQTSVPFIASTARRAASAGQRPFDTASTFDLIRDRLQGGPPAPGLYLNPARDPYRFPVAAGMLAPLGANVYREDPAALERRYRKELREFEQAMRSTERRKRREARSRTR